jgi:hypothetical protein
MTLAEVQEMDKSQVPLLRSSGFSVEIRGADLRSCSTTTLLRSTALSFVISTGAQRSGEICGVSGPPLGMFFYRDLRFSLPSRA